MRNKDKKQIITEFLQGLAEKDIHLVDLGKFDYQCGVRSPLSLSHRTRSM